MDSRVHWARVYDGTQSDYPAARQRGPADLSALGRGCLKARVRPPPHPPRNSPLMSDLSQPTNGSVDRLSAATSRLREQLARVIVGQHDVIDRKSVGLGKG